MKTKKKKQFWDTNLPDLQVGLIWKKIIGWVAHIHYIYWVMLITVALALFVALKPDYVWNHLWPRLRANGTIVILILVFCAVAVSLIWKTGERIDVWVFMAFNVRGRRSAWFDWSMLGLTQLGNGIFALLVALFFFLREDRLFAYEIILGTLTLWLVVELLKIIIRRTRPYLKLKNIRIIGSRAGGHSFPSGHTSQAFFMATLLLQYLRFGLLGVIALYVLALLVGITRMYVGMHYPRDVIAGAVFGTAWGLLGVIINNYIW